MKMLPLSSVSFDEEFRLNYRISKDLEDSIRRLGVKEPLKVFPQGELFRIFSGHNRYLCARKLLLSELPIEICAMPDEDFFIREGLYRSFSGKLSFRGKLSLLNFRSAAEIPDLKIPREFFSSTLMPAVKALPVAVLDYLDEKDAPFKLAELVALLPAAVIAAIADTAIQRISLSLFRKIIQLSSEGVKNGFEAEIVSLIRESESPESLLKAVERQVYPSFSDYREKAGVIIERMRRRGVDIQFAEYFDSPAEIRIKVKKRDAWLSVERQIEQIDKKLVDEIAELL